MKKHNGNNRVVKINILYSIDKIKDNKIVKTFLLFMLGLIWLIACENSDSIVSNKQFDLSKNNQITIMANQQESNSPKIIFSEKKI